MINNCDKLNMIHQKINICTLCPLCQSRNKAVPGEGPSDAKIMIIGEGPGELNDLYGRPFIGRGGQILDGCLLDAHLDRDQLFLTNVIKCRMPHNATPSTKIISTCSAFLDEQISTINPVVIISLGLPASVYLTGDKKIKLSNLQGKILARGNQKLLCSYHPSSIRYNKDARQNIVDTLMLAKNICLGEDK